MSAPCPVSWESLPGDDRIRHCGKCSLNVYNLAVMSKEEVASIVLKTEGRLCGRLYLRGDQTATVKDCPTARVRRTLKPYLALGAVLLLGAISWILRTQVQPDRNACPPLIRRAVNWLDPGPPPMLLGEIKCVPPPPK